MNATFTALAEPNRLHIVELLRHQPRSVNEISERLGLRQPLVSKHLRTLSEAGLVTARAEAQRRIYQLEPKPLKELNVWVNSFAHVWKERLDRFDDYLQTVKKAKRKK